MYKIPRTDLAVSRLAYGVGAMDFSWVSSNLMETTRKAVRAAHENGITFFDTADVYAGGQSDVALSELFRGSSRLRDEIVIQSKCGLRIRRGWRPGEPIAPDSIGVDLSRRQIIGSVEESLRRLQTDRLDILLLHVPSALLDPQDVACAFDELHRDGKVRHFGVCDHNVMQLELLRRSIRQELVANQMWLSLVHYAPIHERSGFGSLVDYCRIHDIQVQAFSPLKGGTIFGKPWLLAGSESVAPELRKLSEMLEAIASKHSATPAAIMLAWLLRHPAGIVPIMGSTNPVHIAQNCAADGIDLSVEEWTTLLNSTSQIQTMQVPQ